MNVLGYGLEKCGVERKFIAFKKYIRFYKVVSLCVFSTSEITFVVVVLFTSVPRVFLVQYQDSAKWLVLQNEDYTSA